MEAIVGAGVREKVFCVKSDILSRISANFGPTMKNQVCRCFKGISENNVNCWHSRDNNSPLHSVINWFWSVLNAAGLFIGWLICQQTHAHQYSAKQAKGWKYFFYLWRLCVKVAFIALQGTQSIWLIIIMVVLIAVVVVVAFAAALIVVVVAVVLAFFAKHICCCLNFHFHYSIFITARKLHITSLYTSNLCISSDKIAILYFSNINLTNFSLFAAIF